MTCDEDTGAPASSQPSNEVPGWAPCSTDDGGDDVVAAAAVVVVMVVMIEFHGSFHAFQ